MSKNKQIYKVCIAVIVITLVITVLFMNGSKPGIEILSGESGSDSMFTSNDLDGNWDTDGATVISLTGSNAEISGNGAYFNNGSLYIVYAGNYILSGSLENGSLIVKANSNDKIWLMLDGVSISNDSGAAVIVEQAEKVFMTLAEGSKNELSCGESFEQSAVSSGIDGVIYSKDDLTINGSGALIIKAEYKHGIVCNDDLVITGGTITVDAVKDGIHANDSIRMCNASLEVNAGDDGLTASNDENDSFIYIESGSLSIPSCYEGIEATEVTVDGGTLNISPGDDGINANSKGSDSLIRINGGDITILNKNGRDADGLDSNGSIEINGGNMLISVSDSGGNCAIDYGSESGGSCIINAGTVIACGSSAMAEGISSESSQGFFIKSDIRCTDETVVTLKSSDGTEIISQTVPYGFSYAIISTPEMKVGNTYTLSLGDTSEEITVDNSSPSGFGQGGRPFDGKDKFGERGQTNDAPEMPSGEMPSGDMQPPEMPSGKMPSGDMQPPEMPNGEMPSGNMQPPEMPDNKGFEKQGNQ